MRQVETINAIGHILCHDITQIIKDVKKDVVFKKGHQVTAEDIPVLLSVGKEHLYVWEYDETKLHENEAAEILCDLCKGENLEVLEEIKEGKIELYASCDGVLQISVERLHNLNAIEDIVVATRHNQMPVKKGEKVAGMRIVPLVMEKEKLQQIEIAFSGHPLLHLKPYQRYQVGIVTTGSEVFHGRIQDTFGPVIRQKLGEYQIDCIGQKIVEDKKESIEQAIDEWIAEGATMIICTGGMSVDPDDVTPSAIKGIGGDVITYGAPVLPGAMFMLAYKGEVPILGLPGCVMYAKRTIFDLVLPCVLTGERLQRSDLTKLGHGGLCLACELCHFPNCSFGKGV